MLQIKATASEGQRYTYRVKRYSLLRKMGWEAFRHRGQVFFLPPGVKNFLDEDYISRVVYGQPSSEQRDFRELCMSTPMAETSKANLPGVFWDGKNLSLVGSNYADLLVKPIEVTTPQAVFVGVEVSYTDNGEICIYWMLTDRLVDMRTFYKYLLFYKRRISIKIISGSSRQFTTLPYGKDSRLGATCTVRNL